MEVRRISSPPPNAAAFIAEIAAGIEALYGPLAAEHYRRTAPEGLCATLAHPTVYAVAAFNEWGEALGYLVAVQRAPAAHITFLNVLSGWDGQSIENRLVERAAGDFQRAGLDHIVCECVPFCRLDLSCTFSAFGFERIERVLMMASVQDTGSAPKARAPISSAVAGPSTPRVLTLDAGLRRAAAECLVEAYRDSRGRRLHMEVTDVDRAQVFVSRVAAGGFGHVHAEYGKAVFEGDQCVAVALGCETAPDVGFVLQVAVRPKWRRQGFGTLLLHELAASFRQTGLTRVALGVTRDNPARLLYERLGFTALRPVDAYVWWRPGREP
ncbi:MAG TPA: GNAT family N-acetyltransferase [Candidatus Hydrogenedentes bacterium]|nr:GNAT family N-acetyltransferase [Candidatus Hydrogenedentota bacterium]